MKRSAQVALELATPKRVLAPLKAIALPCNLVRQGLEKMWDLGLKIGHAAGKHLGKDFTLLTQIPVAVLRPIQSAIQKITTGEKTLEKTLEPKPGFRFHR